MLSRNDVKYIQSLCHKKFRQQEGLFIAETPKLVDELLQSEYVIKNVYATKAWMDHHHIQQVPATEINDIELERISALQTPNQVVAVVQQKETAPVNIRDGWVLVLDGIQDPGNFGTIIRIADWFGIKHIVCSHDTADVYNPKVVQSTMGSFVRVNIVYTEPAAFIQQVNVPVFGALLQGENIYTLNNSAKGIIVIGNEGKGIRPELLPFISRPVTIPKIGRAESLNAAVATGIIVSHLLS